MLMYIFTHILVMYGYTLCFLVHTHMYTHNRTNVSLCPIGKIVQSPQFTAHKKWI